MCVFKRQIRRDDDFGHIATLVHMRDVKFQTLCMELVIVLIEKHWDHDVGGCELNRFEDIKMFPIDVTHWSAMGR